MSAKRNFKTAYRVDYNVTHKEIKDIISLSKDVSLPLPFIRSSSYRYTLPYDNLFDIINSGKGLYYVVYSDCYWNGKERGEYCVSSHAEIIHAKSQKAVREYVMKGTRTRRGLGDGRCVNCLMEISKMHPYEIAQMLNASFPHLTDEDRWYASYCKEYPSYINNAYIQELCEQYQIKYGETVDAWKANLSAI